MATEEPRSPLSPSSGTKHRRSPEEAPEEEESPKRRKHHRRHRHHHRRRRNPSKSGLGKEEEDDDDDPALSMEAEAEAEAFSSTLAKVGDDEREEGEIVEEEEDEVGGRRGASLGVGGASDVESGEIGRDAANKAPTLVASGDDDTKDPKIDVAMLDIFCQSENSAEKDEAWVKGEGSVRRTHDWRNGRSSLSDGENKDMINKSLHRRDEKGKRDRDVNASHPKTRARSRSRSPVSKEPSHHKRNDLVHYRDQARSIDHKREKSYERILELHEDGGARARKHGSEDGDRHDADRNLVRSRESGRGAYRESERSSSYSRHDGRSGRHDSRERDRDRRSMDVDEVTRRERERSSSHSRYDRREGTHYSREGDREGERRSSITRDKDSDTQRDRSRERYRERERAKSERERERDDDRERRERDRTRSEREREREIDDRDRSRAKDREQRGQSGRDRVSIRDRHGDSRHSRYDDQERPRSKDMSREAYSHSKKLEEGKANAIREEDEDYQEKIEQQLAEQEEEDVDKIKEESRKRRQAILEKYKQQKLQKQQPESLPCISEKEEKPLNENDTTVENASNGNSHSVRKELESKHDSSDVYVADPSFAVGKSPTENGAPANKKTAIAAGLGQGSPKSEKSVDMFCDDIFGESPAGVLKTGKGDNLQIERSGLHDNWDDAEGYYSYRFGEVLDGHYEVIAAHGKGVFSTVVRAKDLKAGKGDPEEVAIKIIRNNETMYKAGLDELVILKKLAGADPEDKRHCVRFLSSFKYRNHLCLVFESLHMNLREVLKKFGRNIGLKLTAVRAYGKQLFIALKHLRNCGVLHCDIKPDNMLVNEAKNVLKLCDFGNAMFAGKNEITPYLVSRFYRAPEIILGLPYDHPLDIWSVGCCLYELYTGKVLFPGPSNNDMLRLHMELKGPFPKKMLRKGAFTDQHFDQDLNFHATEEDPVTKKAVKRLLLNIKPKDIGALISTFPGEDPKMLASFKDLLERIFVLDPEKRMTVSQALSHPFITGK